MIIHQKNLLDLILKNPFIKNKHLYEKSCGDLYISGITANSLECKNNYLFVATKGATTSSKNGHDFIDQAIKNGAVAIIVDDDYVLKKKFLAPVIKADNSKKALCYFAESFYDHPSSFLKIIGITGTNGKTSTSFMLHSILKAAGFNTRLMGTLGMGEPNNLTLLTHTTMDPVFLSSALYTMKSQGVTHVILEVSSHALSLSRVEALKFCAVGLTNISQDHLDFHKSLADYVSAKARLFFELTDRNTPKILPKGHPFNMNGILDNLTFFDGHNFFAKNISEKNGSSHFDLYIEGKILPIDLPFLGCFQVKNALLAAALAKKLLIEDEQIKKGLNECKKIPGRLEPIPNKNGLNIFVDFAHAPDALNSLLLSVKKLKFKKIVLVFGCGGDRDFKKRSLMGEIAQKFADVIIVTDDNPRLEDPKKIRQQILAGINTETDIFEIPDRQIAIKKAITMAKKNDAVIIAGKGHEIYQIFGKEQIHFSDKEEVLKILDSP